MPTMRGGSRSQLQHPTFNPRRGIVRCVNEDEQPGRLASHPVLSFTYVTLAFANGGPNVEDSVPAHCAADLGLAPPGKPVGVAIVIP